MSRVSNRVPNKVDIQKGVLDRLCYQADTNAARLATELGFSYGYFSVAFAKKGSVASFPRATAVAICQTLGCTMEELTEPPKTATVSVNTAPTQIVHGVDPELIKEGFRMIHGDLQELIKLWKPEIEEIRIGGEASK